jgi:hypothetical protein
VTAVPALVSWSRYGAGTLAERVEHLRQLGHITEYGATELLALLRPPGRRKHLYRVTATWQHAPTSDGDRPADTVRVRHFQSKQAADRSARDLLAGLPDIPGDGYDYEGKPAVPPATSVTVERSEPVVWPGVPR